MSKPPQQLNLGDDWLGNWHKRGERQILGFSSDLHHTVTLVCKCKLSIAGITQLYGPDAIELQIVHVNSVWISLELCNFHNNPQTAVQRKLPTLQ